MRIVLLHVQDLTFDYKYKTDTSYWAELSTLAVVGGNKEHGVQYQPTQERSLRRIFREVGFPKSGLFLDIGCGKGRVLMIASDYGFRRLCGVDFSELLCRIARANLAIYSKAVSHVIQYEITHADAAIYEIHDEASVIFLNNPFDETVMYPVVTNVLASLRRRPRDLCVIYANPTCRRLFDEAGIFSVVAEYETAQLKYLIYRCAYPQER